MKWYRIAFASLLLISSTSFAFEAYDYTPIDYNDDYSHESDSYQNDNVSTDNDHYSPRHRQVLIKHRFAHGGKTFVFDPKALRWYAYYNGELINSGRASGGRHYCPDIHRPCRTPVGVFQVGHKGGVDCKSSKYPIGRGNAPMPWCMFFRGNYAIHGSWEVPHYNASHGCIRVPPPDARWLNREFMSPGTRVIVEGYR